MLIELSAPSVGKHNNWFWQVVSRSSVSRRRRRVFDFLVSSRAAAGVFADRTRGVGSVKIHVGRFSEFLPLVAAFCSTCAHVVMDACSTLTDRDAEYKWKMSLAPKKSKRGCLPQYLRVVDKKMGQTTSGQYCIWTHHRRDHHRDLHRIDRFSCQGAQVKPFLFFYYFFFKFVC